MTQPLEDQLKQAYYYTEAGEWRGPEVDEWDRWHAVAKVAASVAESATVEPVQKPVAWHVCSVNSDGSLSLEFAASWEESAHEHINDAINEYDIDGATSWVVRPVYASPQPQQTEPSQDTTPQRPPTPTGWSDTDWIAHLAVMPPIGYATRDHLYGTSAAGVLRFCPHDEPGAFAVYAAPPQRQPLSDEQITALVREAAKGSAIRRDGSTSHRIARAIERAITGEPT